MVWSRRRVLGTAAIGLTAAAMAACGGAAKQPDAVRVRTDKGEVRGERKNEVTVFRGIPYAQPPVDRLRFAAPIPHDRWDGVREAIEFGPAAPQSGQEATGSQEWLTLNVWTPSVSARDLPVMVWIHGGGYAAGSSAQPVYDGTALAREDVVVVTVNYRVAVEGFAQIQGAPANRGLLDQIAALRWVQANAAAFGGNPRNVTVFGESAGAGSIATLLTIPAAAGSFRRAIAQSVPGSLFSTELATDIASAIAEKVGRQATLGDLAAVSPRDLAQAADGIRAGLADHPERWGYRMNASGQVFAPVVDGVVLPSSPWQALAEGSGRDIDLLVGHNRDEYRLMIAAMGGADAVPAAQIESALRLLPPVPDGAQAYRDAYPGVSDSGLYELVNSDLVFRMPSLHLGRAHTAGGGQTHLDELRYDKTPIGAAHINDVPLVFGTFDTDDAIELYGNPPAADAVAVSREMRTAWTNFAKTGDPGWPAYQPDTQFTRLFDSTSTTARYPEQGSQQIWADYTFGPLPLPTPGQK